MNVDLVPVFHVDQFWPHLRDGFDKAILKTGGDITVGELWAAARSGTGFLFVAHDPDHVHGASLWRFETWQSGSKFRCLALYGTEMSKWIEDMHKAVKQAAGRALLVSEGRRGWAKIFPDAQELRVLYEEKT